MFVYGGRVNAAQKTGVRRQESGVSTPAPSSQLHAPSSRPVVAEATRLRAPRLEGGDTFVLPIETHAGVIEYRIQRGALENLGDNINALLERGLTGGERLELIDLKIKFAELRHALEPRPAAKHLASLSLHTPGETGDRSQETEEKPAPRMDPVAMPRPAPRKDPNDPRTAAAMVKWKAILNQWIDSGLSVRAFEMGERMVPNSARNAFLTYFRAEYSAHVRRVDGRRTGHGLRHAKVA